jgi:hypothetical protein
MRREGWGLNCVAVDFKLLSFTLITVQCLELQVTETSGALFEFSQFQESETVVNGLSTRAGLLLLPF